MEENKDMTVDEKLDILGKTVTELYQEVQFMRHLFGVLQEKGVFDDEPEAGE